MFPLEKGWLSRKFLLRGRWTHKPTLVHCCLRLHNTFFFFLVCTHHKAVRRSGTSFRSVSLTCAFCSQRPSHTHTHTHSETAQHAHTRTHTLAHALRDFHPLPGRGIPPLPCETTPLRANWHGPTSSEHNAQPMQVMKEIHTGAVSSLYWFFFM